MSSLSKWDISMRHKCHKGCSKRISGTYDKTTIQKLTEVFSFDYPRKKENWGPAGKDYSNSTYRCCHNERGSESDDDFTYAPLETFRSPMYPLSLPPPRSDDDIRPASSNQEQSEQQQHQQHHQKQGCTERASSRFLNLQNQLLLHDLFSGDIYDI